MGQHGRIERFEDLIAWQKARQMTRNIYQCTCRKPFADDWDLVRQIRRAAVSAMSNIAEGFERSGRKEFQQFLSMAKASCAEVRSQIYVVLDLGYVDPQEFDALMRGGEEPARIIGGLRASIAKLDS
ncbi:MAG: hypothetical protein BIFFINMI_01449 [Phycisphaerae bacterium]|nr:hypothetical protein [Phycisphaerae bacterium]